MDSNNKNRSSSDEQHEEQQQEYYYKDNDSIYSTTSSMFSTSSRMGRITGGVKSSLKNLVRRSHRPSTSSNSEDSLTKSTTKRPSINFSHLLSRNNKREVTTTTPNEGAVILPTSTTSSTLFGYNKTTSSSDSSSLLSFTKQKRRNSVVNLASRFLNSSSSSHSKKNSGLSTIVADQQQLSLKEEEEVEEPKGDTVGKLLFGKQVNDLEFFVHHEDQLLESDSKSEKVLSIKKEEPWIRQRAKSVQVSLLLWNSIECSNNNTLFFLYINRKTRLPCCIN